MNLNHYLKVALEISQKAGKILLKNYQKKIKINYKDEQKINLVTALDQKIEKFIINKIKKEFKGHSILGEESGSSKNISDFCWIIDPIDGTTNFVHGHPFFAISIGLQIKEEICVGVVYAPSLKELFYGVKKGGAFLNGKRIKVSKIKNLKQSLLGTGFSYKNKSANLPYVKYFLKRAQGIRRCGSAAIDLCYVAAGRYDGFFEMGLKPWDIAAGKLIIEEAGGKLSDFSGKKLKLDGPNILATNGFIHNEMVKELKAVKLQK